METQPHYAHYARMAEKLGIATAVERCRSAFCSLLLSRNFGETTDAFLARSPRAAQLNTFLQEHTK